MGGKSSDKSSKQMIQMQKDEAQQARDKETARADRIKGGLERIRQAFEGSPVKGTREKSFDWGSSGATGGQTALPSGYSWVQGAGTTTATPAAAAAQAQANQRNQWNTTHDHTMQISNAARPSMSGSGRGGDSTVQDSRGGTTTTPGEWMIRGPDGKLYKKGESIPYYEQYDTGETTGGIGQSFYDKFKQGMLDYYTPQVAEQYGKAKDETTFRHARAGTLRSTSAAESAADLSKQNEIRKGEVLSKADAAAAELKGRVAAEKAKAESQLYATEDPDVATNQALAAITNISAEQPELTPLGQIFDIASIGGANYMKGAGSASLKKYVPGKGGYGATRTVS